MRNYDKLFNRPYIQTATSKCPRLYIFICIKTCSELVYTFMNNIIKTYRI